jgi:hypothetical protein
MDSKYLLRSSQIGLLLVAACIIVFNIFFAPSNFFTNGVVSTQRTDLVQTDEQGVFFWFFALDCKGGHLLFYAKQAVLSALHYTNLIPVLMLHCRNEPLETWMKAHGVIIADPSSSSLVDFLDKHPEKLTNLGATTWYRIAIPKVIDALIEAGNERVTQALRNNSHSLQYVLYTDADVVFTSSMRITTDMLPRYFALPIQGNNWCCGEDRYSRKLHTNAGVIVMNVSAMREVETEFVEYVQKNILLNSGTHPSFSDQTAFHQFFPVRPKQPSLLQWLELRLFHPTYFETLNTKYYSETLRKEYEWEPYLGVNAEAKIVHWHGPKVFLDSCAALNLGHKLTPQRSLLMDARQGLIKQLMLANRTAPYVVSSPPSPQSLRSYDSNRSISHNGGLAHAQETYPPVYDWYTNMPVLSVQERTAALAGAEKKMFFLQTLLACSPDGYHHAVSLFFAYAHVICTTEL